MNKLDISRATEGLTNQEIRGYVMMATNIYFNQRLNKELGEYTEFGFNLKKSGSNTVDLYFKDKKLATLDADKATMDVVREGCKNYLASLARSA